MLSDRTGRDVRFLTKLVLSWENFVKPEDGPLLIDQPRTPPAPLSIPRALIRLQFVPGQVGDLIQRRVREVDLSNRSRKPWCGVR